MSEPRFLSAQSVEAAYTAGCIGRTFHQHRPTGESNTGLTALTAEEQVRGFFRDYIGLFEFLFMFVALASSIFWHRLVT